MELFTGLVEWRRDEAFLATAAQLMFSGGMLGMTCPEICHNRFDLFHVQEEIVVFTPWNEQLTSFLFFF